MRVKLDILKGPFVLNLKLSKKNCQRLLKGKEKENVLLYCTGGIRCEKASAYLKASRI